MALLMTLRRMGRVGPDDARLPLDVPRLGRRDRPPIPTELCEMALAHTVSDKVEAAYRRGDMVEKRARLMKDWAEFCATPAPAGRSCRSGGRQCLNRYHVT